MSRYSLNNNPSKFTSSNVDKNTGFRSNMTTSFLSSGKAKIPIILKEEYKNVPDPSSMNGRLIHLYRPKNGQMEKLFEDFVYTESRQENSAGVGILYTIQMVCHQVDARLSKEADELSAGDVVRFYSSFHNSSVYTEWMFVEYVETETPIKNSYRMVLLNEPNIDAEEYELENFFQNFCNRTAFK